MIDRFHDEFAFLSNFAPVPNGIGDGERIYPTVEHFYQAAKFSSSEHKISILNMESPGKTKRYSREHSYDIEWWDDESVRLCVMEEGLRQKFQNLELKNALLATGDQTLVEGNWWHDQFWGSCSCVKHADKPGQNHLGRLLMLVRAELR